MLRTIWPLTGRGTVTLVAGVALLFIARIIETPALIGVAILLIGLPLLSAASLWIGRPAGLRRRYLSSDVVAAGDDVHVRYDVAVGGFARGPVRWRNRVRGERARRFSGELSVTSGSGIADVSITTAARGTLTVEPLLLIITDALGFAHRTVVLAHPTEVAVGPAIVPLPSAQRSPESHGDVRAAAVITGSSTDDLLARPYADGDSMRRVHWRATAHHGDLMVRQDEAVAAPHASIILALTGPGVAHAPQAFELALAALMSIAYRLVHDDVEVTVTRPDGTLVCPRITEPSGLSALLAVLAAEEPLAALPDDVGRWHGSVLVVCGADVDAAVSSVHRGSRSSFLTLAATDRPPGRPSDARLRTVYLSGTASDAIASAWHELTPVRHA